MRFCKLIKHNLSPVLVAVFLAFGVPASAAPNPYADQGDFFAGPFRAVVIRIIDADTLVVAVDIWPGTVQRAHIRLRNVDAPELRTACEAEKLLAQEATDWVKDHYLIGQAVRLDDVEPDSFGRFIADIRRWRSDRWLYLADELVERDFAIPSQRYDEEINWCKGEEIDRQLFEVVDP